ncbi:hypothetical protein [Sphingobium sp. Leaf26]|uniref:hypothetical protein n=1 Tax=Sphingobium sp. Leaf26 TaxID=1735693 RepID=UPI000AC51154|nr:hypothetical protein [Sphingobium sp. Leaf26]
MALLLACDDLKDGESAFKAVANDWMAGVATIRQVVRQRVGHVFRVIASSRRARISLHFCILSRFSPLQLQWP